MVDDEVLKRHRRSLNDACAALGISMATLLESSAGSWYDLRVEEQLRNATPSTDLALAISNTIELAADLPEDQRKKVQGIGIMQLLRLS